MLEGAQAGLSWITILKKREDYRTAFAGFDPEAVARYAARRGEAHGGCRNRAKPRRKSRPRSAMRGHSSQCRMNRGASTDMLGVCQRKTDPEPVADVNGIAGPHGGVGRDEQGPQAARI